MRFVPPADAKPLIAPEAGPVYDAAVVSASASESAPVAESSAEAAPAANGSLADAVAANLQVTHLASNPLRGGNARDGRPDGTAGSGRQSAALSSSNRQVRRAKRGATVVGRASRENRMCETRRYGFTSASLNGYCRKAASISVLVPGIFRFSSSEAIILA